ncbi:2-oxoglutarate dehydrogenase complex dihydrolipoyllysine-residue succinyltransferase [Bartonella sp. DGB2]|uniref:2-oxoglutarate dehydrogenase complex dihydrolipoyllysine-residue succinyltransferase n=1 Tax=Bartonella sp. DGB2 TaxID=3388426 RepID=UPI00398FC445
MVTEIRVPTLGESVTEATIGKWLKQVGETVLADEPLVELETDKVTLEVPAPAAGVLNKILTKEGETVELGALLGIIQTNGAAISPTAPQSSIAPANVENKMPTAMPPAPSAAKLIDEQNLHASSISGSGKRGQILKSDVLETITVPKPIEENTPIRSNSNREERVKMTKLRQTIARRLKDAQNTAAMLTTFNEVDMTAVMDLRKRYKDVFEKKHGVKLGFMGFFSRAICHALHELPAINAEIDGTDIVYKNYVNLAIAVGTDKGLVVPVVRDADQMSIAEIEKEIGRLGRLARDGKLAVADMLGGSFTITNGGVYGSLMSTPILNAPQSGILGMHAIKERAVVVAGQIVIRPMMYLALSYDHRIVDGQEAVTFLVRVKESLEDPERLVLDL